MKSIKYLFCTAFCSLLLLFTVGSSCAQQADDYQIVVSPESLKLQMDETAQLSATLQGANGNVVQDSVLFYSRDRTSVSVSQTGKVKALQPGTFELQAVAMSPDSNRINKSIQVVVSYPPITAISFQDLPKQLYANSKIPVKLSATDAKNMSREDAQIQLSSSDPAVASINEFDQLYAQKPGSVTITAKTADVTAQQEIKIVENPVTDIQLQNDAQNTRSGDVVHFDAQPLDASGEVVNDLPVEYTFTAQPDDNLGEGTSGQIKDDGRFVANKPGLYTIVARAGNVSAENTIRVDARDIQKELEVVGHGLVSDVHTSDLWVWEGVDGRDYAITGTWGGNGETYFWDVTDPANMSIIDTVTVDARTVNDVKISEDGRIGVITREGASDRKNGIVILDVSDPRNVSIISEYTRGLTGGVHNSFIYQDHVFAVNNGRRYDIIDISDPENPATVSRFELDTPGHSIHDVWVENGIAYSSNWDDGIVAVDVGSTPNAQSPEQHSTGVGSLKNPVKLGSYSYPSGWNHAAFPFKSKSTDDFYVIAGDEAFPNGLFVHDKPTIPAGWIHFVKFEDGWDNPKEVARYQVPEAGTHNFWVKDDTLYIAYYNAGLRVVDISGELMGNLYDQGREIAKYVPTHHEGIIPNAAMTWGPQPYKGHIFVSDWNSGIWALKLED
ncbi:Ig-like domain-containing protein [Fodinibius salsisoli]|uniref:Ig-like domain-containing protein n=1 Tax=Fodinibius salsisoli TaxID=2820877 RepID=A0ABT3PS13_9BACT|nr:Ig-like domain-containing protein [Fodinibius salsisoli]MCW9708631.1 Ig-like domain-containing protein [Fodinibius salsisoli]